MMSVWTKFVCALHAFRIARAGNVAITFAFATLPIIAFVGFSVDYSRANSVKVALQNALDATGLMLSKEATTDTSDQLQANAQKYFMAQFIRSDANNVSVNATYTANGGTRVIINASADVPTTLLNVIGISKVTVTTSSTSTWGAKRLRVALVLDNTGSMADDGKMTALQSATKNLLTQLQTAVTVNGDVYVSIVPFVKDVNIGAANYNSDYIYWGTLAQDPTLSDNNSWDANNGQCSIGSSSSRSSCLSKKSCSISAFTSQSSCTGAGTCSLSGFTSQSSCTGAGSCSQSGYTSQSTCTAAGTCSLSGHNSQNSCTSSGTCSNPGQSSQNSCTGSKACTKSQYSSKNSCQSNGGVWGFGSWTAATWTAAIWTSNPGTWTAGVWSTATTTWTPSVHNATNWNGCVVDRGNSSGPDTVGNYDTNAVAPSTTIMSTLYAAEQYGSCPQPVMSLNYDWSGMSTLVDNMGPAGNTNQAIGLQLGWMSLVGGGPFSVPAMDPNYQYQQIIILLTDGLNTQDRWYTSQSSIDAREQLTCNNIKSAGVTLYTIQVNTGGDPTSTLLQNCASSSDKFYLLTSASQIVTVFNQIGTALTQLRIAQ